MRVVREPEELLRAGAQWRRRGESVGFVPTMGALHEGHRSLIQRARRENRRVVVSIFVNPLQFGPDEDYNRYPRPFYQDRRLCESSWVDALYRPSPEAMYPEGFATAVEVRGLSDLLDGEFRPGHFRGVATVVLKLLQQVRPDKAYFGEKDYQQLIVLGRMARDLDLGVEIVPCPTVRERDGLALSSRNAYLSANERANAPLLYRALAAGCEAAKAPGAKPERVTRLVKRLVQKIPRVSVDYIRLVDAATLEEAERLRGRLRLLAAIRLGRTRLIDNLAVPCKEQGPNR
ncbi:MAG: pantoate--beta-alanine ligase [Elusimicrobia bacterium]|nr:pantoate--beta-alanine ligase [Elusimicrobiota bacterium]